MSLRVDNLRVHYQTLRGRVQALDGVTFTIDDGEIMGLAGESGCGKTTLGTSMVRLVPPMTYIEGSVELDGTELPVWDDGRMRRFRYKDVSVIPQYAMSALNPTRKIGRMTAELLKSRGVSYRSVERELRARLDLVELSEDVLGRYPIELSGGMKQRVVMVLSTLLNPSLLIADEITSALDVSSQRAVSEMLTEFRDRGYVKSVIFITHDVSVLAQIADSITIMYAGKLAEKAPTSSLINDPKHPYSKLLIESLPEMGVRHAERALAGIPGRPPALLNPPEGCRFRARCPLAIDTCLEQPPFAEVRAAHHSACWNAEDV
ncbi:MAG TPA: ABC transporter ATP-binding protein [Euzebyales bacterium]|nr:ABC transporter ATP-binding protein [Euzebyales bacterium]